MKGSKLSKRVLAVLLSLTMVMSGMTVSATEVSETIVVSEEITTNNEETLVEEITANNEDVLEENEEVLAEENSEVQIDDDEESEDELEESNEETNIISELEDLNIAAFSIDDMNDDDAKEKTYVFDATSEKSITSLAKGTSFTASSVGTDGFFLHKGSGSTRSNSDKFSLQLAASENSYLEFTVKGVATVTLKVSSTGSSNESEFGIYTANNTLVENTEKATAVKGSNAVEYKYLELEAGTYKICTKSSARGVRVYYISVTDSLEEETVPEETINISTFFDPKELKTETKTATTETSADGYFDIIYADGSKVEDKAVTIDGFKSTKRVNFAGEIKSGSFENSIKFTTSQKYTVVTIYWQAASANKEMQLLNASGEQVAKTAEVPAKDARFKTKFRLDSKGTYYLGGLGGKNYIFGVQVDESNILLPRADWNTVAAPVITSAVATTDGKITVNVNSLIGYDGADSLTVSMYDIEENQVSSQKITTEGNAQTITFTPSNSGTYSFKASLVRDAEEKVSEEVKTVDFTLPLAGANLKSVTNKGNGKVEVAWDAVTEATGYIVCVDDKEVEQTSNLVCVLDGLTVGKDYTFGVKAVREELKLELFTIEKTISDIGTTKTITVKDENQRTWAFSAFGQGTDTKNNGYDGEVNDGSVTVYSEGGKGKIVPASNDGLAFYYTAIDAEKENFTLTADIHVDKWTLSNGQEGFGIMVCDAVGANGYGTNFWNNSYQAIASKIEYYYDKEAKEVTTDTSATKVSMKLGLGYNARTGVTKEDVESFTKTGEFKKADGTTASLPENFTAETGTLETYGATLGVTNIVGNATAAVETTMENALTDFKLQIQRNNTGYYLRYLDNDNNVIMEKRYYDQEREALSAIDDQNVYVGFFASRNARITVSNVELKVINAEDDEEAEDRETEYIYPNYTIESASTANSSNYTLAYVGNADGKLTIINKTTGKTVVSEKEVTANVKSFINTEITLGTTEFEVTMTPDENYIPGEYKKLTSYDTVTFSHTVDYRKIAGSFIYVSQNGKSTNAGTSSSPIDIYTAVKYAAAGQTIVLAGGEYNLNKTVKIDRGIDGTAENMIYMIADPNTNQRPVFNFGGKCAGMVFGGDYWYFSGFDCTKSANAQKGIQVSGSHNTLDDINAYMNGNTGIQISRLNGTDEYDQWPSYNLILNCTSYLNADAGYEDADGFAAKLTVADGNVFDGCISAYNADDGWDLFAKAQSGSIGSVTIKNSVTYRNGYVLKNDNGELDINGKLVNAGNGNGFKMGGDSMPGAHVLINSIAFENKAKGFDSNSCPDIKVYNSTSFNNEGANVAFYTNTAVNTAYYAQGVLSYKTNNDVVENIKKKGSQVDSDIYGSTNFYTTGKEASSNLDGKSVASNWFVALTYDESVGLFGITRNSDGTINMNGFLELTDEVPAGVGARMTGTASRVFSADPFTTSTGTDSSASQTASEENASSSSSSSQVTYEATSVNNDAVLIAADIETEQINGLPVFTYKLSQDSLLKMKLFETYHSVDAYVLLNLGGKVGASVKSVNGSKATKDVDLKLTMAKTAKDMVTGYDSFKVSPRTTGEIGFDITLHFNLGVEYVGKRAYFFNYNKETKSYTLVGSMLVNQIGNVCIDTSKIEEIVILIPQK